MKFRITYADETVDVDQGPRSEYEFEKRFDLALSDAFRGESPRHTYLYYIAWAAAYYAEKPQEHREFEDFLSAAKSIEIVGDDEGSVDPTEQGQ